MTDSVLQTAIDCLSIREVSLRQSSAWLAEDYDPRFSSIEAMQPQFKHLVERSYLMEVRDEASSYYVFRVFIDLGMRLLPVSRDQAEGEVADETILAQIEATFVAEYESQTDPGTEALEAFARQNASYHVWPYWREFVSSQCARMGLPRVTIPAVQVASNGAGASDS
jgi:hypothetical protein